MAKKFTLDDIRAAAEQKYADTEVEGVTFVNALRLSKEKRKALTSLQDQMDQKDEDGNEIDVDQVEVFKNALRTVTKGSSKDKLEDLFDEIGDDLTILVEIFNVYAKGTQAGEASASQD